MNDNSLNNNVTSTDTHKIKLFEQGVVITGASQGLGLAIAKAFLSKGSNVTICSRNEKQLFLAQKELEQLNAHNKKIVVLTADISNESDVNNLMKKAYTEMGKISVLICNAAIHGPKGAFKNINWDEWCNAIDINLKGSVYACKSAIPYLIKNGCGKIIMLSGGGAANPRPNLSAYAVSKAAIVRFAETLALELQDDRIDVNAIAPGALNTRLLDEILEAGAEKVGEQFYQQSLKQKQNGGVSLMHGADLCLYLAALPIGQLTGKLISAVWDNWKAFGDCIADIQSSDVFTLRRIVPEDRNLLIPVP